MSSSDDDEYPQDGAGLARTKFYDKNKIEKAPKKIVKLRETIYTMLYNKIGLTHKHAWRLMKSLTNVQLSFYYDSDYTDEQIAKDILPDEFVYMIDLVRKKNVDCFQDRSEY